MNLRTVGMQQVPTTRFVRAHVTLEGFLAGVCPDVSLDVGILLEAAVTDGALEIGYVAAGGGARGGGGFGGGGSHCGVIGDLHDVAPQAGGYDRSGAKADVRCALLQHNKKGAKQQNKIEQIIIFFY